MQWQIGDVKVTLVREQMMDVPIEFMYAAPDPAVLRDNADWLAPYVNADGTMPMSVHAYILDDGAQVVMVDTCMGCWQAFDDTEPTLDAREFLPTMSSAGYTADDIDMVLSTHFHYDHVGWNTRIIDGKWVPAFPKARYLFAQTEYDHAIANPAGATGIFDYSVRPIIDAGQADLVAMDHRVNDWMQLIPATGHTKGHVNVMIESQGDRGLITADTFHHPIQFAAPHWHMLFDEDPATAVVTRTAMRDRLVDSGIRIFGSHFPATSSGFLESAGKGSFRFV